MDFELKKVMNELKKERPVFHNERDFQFALAWKIKEIYPDYIIRLEYCYPQMQNNKRSYVDLVLSDDNRCILFELKYKTVLADIFDPQMQEIYHLQNHSAQDYGCHAVLNDLSRIEKEVINGGQINGRQVIGAYSILITNDKKYQKGFHPDSLFGNYGFNQNKRFYAGKRIEFIVPTGKTKPETCAKNFEEITLLRDYDVHWETYSDLGLSMLVFACEKE